MEKCMMESLIKDIGIDRYNHTLRVVDTTLELAKIYKVNEDKAKIAALFHDCGKLSDETNLLKRASDFGIILDNIMENNRELIHGPLGAKIAEKDYNIKDKEILNAIYYHTTGRENMTALDKIIYIADYIEPYRNFPGVKEVRELAYKDLDNSVLLAIDNTLRFLMGKGSLIHVDTIKARNDLILTLNSK